jgi:hypothetical protein
MLSPWCRAAILALLLAAAPVRAEDLQASANPVYSGISTSAPRSGGLLPSSLFDPSRFSISNSLVFGYSSGASRFGYGNGSAGLFTSSLGYRLKSNMALHVNVGAHMNPAFGGGATQKGIFLEGASFDWRPSGNSLLRVEYRDVRSPLQWGYSPYDYSRFNSGFAGDPLRN